MTVSERLFDALATQIFRLTNHLRQGNPKSLSNPFGHVHTEILPLRFNQSLLSVFLSRPVLSHNHAKILRQIAFLHEGILPLVKRQYIACLELAIQSRKVQCPSQIYAQKMASLQSWGNQNESEWTAL
jgi:hypothetical protein